MGLSPVKRLAQHIGRRGGTLLVLGLVFFLIGVKALIAPSEDDGRFMLYTFLPNFARGVLWIIPAILAIAAAFKPHDRDGFGFAALSIPAVFLTFSYLWSGVAFLLGETDWAFGWTSAVQWLAILTFIFIVSGWPEANPVPARHRQKREGE